MPTPNTYQNIIDEAADWLLRPDLKPIIPTFLYMAENQINRQLRHRKMLKREKATTVLNSAYIAMPEGFLEMKNFQVNDGTVTHWLENSSPEYLDTLSDKPAGRPTKYAVLGDSLQLSPKPDKAYQIEMLFYKRIPHLTAEVQTNFLTDEAGDLLLFATLTHAEPYIKNDERISTWSEAYSSILAMINEEQRRAWHTGSSLQMKVR